MSNTTRRRVGMSIEAQDLLDALIDNLPDAVQFKDVQSRFIRINKALASSYGLKDPAEAMGKDDRDFFSPEFANTTHETEREIMQTGVPRVDIEEKIVWPDGRVSWALTTKMPLRNRSGTIIGTLGISRDIGPQRRAEEEKRHSEALYRSLVDNLPQSFFRKDLDGRFVFANQQFCNTLGKDLKEILGKTDGDLFAPELARKYREDDQRVIQTGVALDTVEAHQPPGKATIYVRVVKTPVTDSDHRAVGIQAIFWEVPPAK